jgi:7-keto-8-aminopelargonate synthetase-like enzyme
MKTLHADLLRRGVLVPLLSSYSGVDPGGVLRITVFADHTTAMIDRLLDELRALI